jgi:hypothetical protein
MGRERILGNGFKALSLQYFKAVQQELSRRSQHPL